MKKIFVIIIVTLLFASCAKDAVAPINQNNTTGISITAEATDIQNTKSGVCDDGVFYWTEDDKISVFPSENGPLALDLKQGARTQTAIFEYKSTEKINLKDAAVFPASIAKQYDGSSLKVVLPHIYEDLKEVKTPMVALIGNDNVASFKHICGLLRISLKGIPDNAQTISVSSSNKISGEFLCNKSENYLLSTCECPSSTRDSTVVNIGEFKNDRDVIIDIPIPSGTYKDLTIRAFDASGIALWERQSSSTKTIAGGDLLLFNNIIVSHKMVDLGLPSGLLWAEMNVGATDSFGYGEYFAFGETQTKEYYTPDNFVGSDSDLTSENDAASVWWGDGWRTPSATECQELLDNCTITTEVRNGIKGDLFTGPNGNSIFLPYAGMQFPDFDDTYTHAETSKGWCIGAGYQYMTSTHSRSLYHLFSFMIDYGQGFCGFPVRPVHEPTGLVYLESLVYLKQGATYRLKFSIPDESPVVWNSDNTSVVSVEDGVISAIGEGETKIKMTSGENERECKVIVVCQPQVSTSMTSSAVIKINDRYFSGSQFGWTITNSSSKIISILGIEIYDASNSESGTILDYKKTVLAGGKDSFVTTLNISMVTPAIRVHYKCEGVEFTSEANSQSLL